MYRTHNCGELRISDLNKEVELSGWVQKIRDKGFITVSYTHLRAHET